MFKEVVTQFVRFSEATAAKVALGISPYVDLEWVKLDAAQHRASTHHGAHVLMAHDAKPVAAPCKLAKSLQGHSAVDVPNASEYFLHR